MAKEHFSYRETPPLFKQLEELSRRSGVSRGQAFEDFLTAIVCALAAETKEPEYLAMIERHKKGKRGQRGADLLPQMFGGLVNAMEETDTDILGDLFQGGITYGEAGQYLTPESLTKLVSELSVDPDARPRDGQPVLINDPACGTGRMLLEAAMINPHAELVGQDIDARCAKITAINLGLRSRYGWVVCGNSLSGETQFAYRIGSFFHESENGLRRGVIRDVSPLETPVPFLQGRLRKQAGELLKGEQEESVENAEPNPMIIEVPQWLNRLEPSLNGLESGRQSPVTQAIPPIVEQPSDDEPPASQRTLFD